MEELWIHIIQVEYVEVLLVARAQLLHQVLQFSESVQMLAAGMIYGQYCCLEIFLTKWRWLSSVRITSESIPIA